MNSIISYRHGARRTKLPAIIFASILLLVPLFAGAADSASDASGKTPSGAQFQFQRQGIFDCNQNGAYAMSVGALSALGGAYVPVADAAVELNTGTLVYKECILREVVDRESESAGTALGKQSTVAILTGRNGNPLFVQKPPSVELTLSATDPEVLSVLQGNTFQKSPFNTAITHSVAQLYEAERNSPQNVLVCPVQGDLNALIKGVPGSFNWSDFNRESDPACYPLGAAGLARELTRERIAQANSDLSQQWNWGRGYYPRFDADGDVVTPASVVQSSFQTQLDSPIHRLENANDIGQMIGALYAGISTQIIGDSGGLAGLTQSLGGQPSYLDQVARESAQGLQGAALNAALQILSATQQVESAYYQAISAVGASLTQTAQQLKDAENQCWAAIVPKVCATPLAADNTCFAVAGPCVTDPNNPTAPPTCQTGARLKVATSTAFSSAVISGQITPLATAATENIKASQNALQIISGLIQGVTNTTSLDAQRVALQQLDSLVAQKKLHTQTDLATVTEQRSSVATAMGNLLQRVAQVWSGTGTDGSANIQWDGTINPGNGWCNVNNPATIQSWIQTWTK